MGMNGPRKLKVTTPSAKLLEDADTFKLSEEESLLSFIPPIIRYLIDLILANTATRRPNGTKD